jgi:hypothetical protein
MAAYAILPIAAFAAPSLTRGALFGVGVATVLLLFVGIHNAWDSIAYHVFVNKTNADTTERRQGKTSEGDPVTGGIKDKRFEH